LDFKRGKWENFEVPLLPFQKNAPKRKKRGRRPFGGCHLGEQGKKPLTTKERRISEIDRIRGGPTEGFDPLYTRKKRQGDFTGQSAGIFGEWGGLEDGAFAFEKFTGIVFETYRLWKAMEKGRKEALNLLGGGGGETREKRKTPPEKRGIRSTRFPTEVWREGGVPATIGGESPEPSSSV